MTRTIKTLLAVALTTCPFIACSGGSTADTQGDAAAVDAGADATHALVDSAVPEDVGSTQDAGEDAFTPLPGDDGGTFDLQSEGEGPIIYWGGPVITGVPNVYFILYGSWLSSNTTPAILQYLIENFGGSPYSKILTAYYQTPQPDGGNYVEAGIYPTPPGADAGPKSFPTGQYHFAETVTVGYTRGTNLQPGDTPGIVSDVITAGTLPLDTQAIYYVLTSADVSESTDFGSFCNDYCGYHNVTTVKGSQIIYSFIGDPGNCLDGCTVQPEAIAAGYSQSPNNNWSADGMASVMIHELSEATSDINPLNDPAWLTIDLSAEIGDMCAWRFEPIYVIDAGSASSPANVQFGDKNYLIQQLWVSNDAGCGLHQ